MNLKEMAKQETRTSSSLLDSIKGQNQEKAKAKGLALGQRGRPRTGAPCKNMQIYLPLDLLDLLAAKAQSTGLAKNELVKRALAKELGYKI